MRPGENIEKLIKALRHEPDTSTHKRIFSNAMQALEKPEKNEAGINSPERRNKIMNSRITKIAAAVVVVVGLSITVSHIAKDQSSSIALGDVFEAMRQITELTWTELKEVEVPEDPNVYVDNLGHVARCYFRAPAQRRREVTTKLKHPFTLEVNEHKHIHIFDRNAGKALLLDPEKMTAEIHDFKPTGGIDPILGAFLAPKANIPQDAEDLGAKKIEGRDAVGFRLRKKGNGTDFWSGDLTEIWVDAKTKRVILLKTGAHDESWAWTLKDFFFDQKLDDSLFSLEPPQGYSEVPPQPIYNVQQ